ncbi:MAG: efflux RND transporter periplasmic adaptor subunit [Desulfovermiculus sp.]|nr:efflux RND transporter periplasmic adaptor subunit [Desulfovermiculus sp.]
MPSFIYVYAKRFVILLPIVAALIIVGYLVMQRPGPEKRSVQESVRTLRIIETPLVDLIPRASGYGVAEPGQVWEAVTEVQGTVVSTHPKLKAGEMISAKSVLVQINQAEYELVVARLRANIEEVRAKISELSAEEENTKRLLEIERRSLELAAKSMERRRKLLEKNNISPDEVDREERNFLQQKQKVRQMENTLALIPSKRKTLKAGLEASQANLEQAKIDLAKTTIKSPFDLRLSNVEIESGQFVRAGQSLFKAHGTGVTEVEARFRPEQLRRLLGKDKRQQFQPGVGNQTFKELFRKVNATIRLQNEDWPADWEARIDRVRETMDAKTREIRVVVAVDKPYEKARPGVRPPLTPGMFCEVSLSAAARPESVVLPRSAVHDRTVFVVDQQNRLQKKQVSVDFAQSDFVVIKSGLSGGEKVVVSDPSPAIAGMKVDPVFDDSLRGYLMKMSQAKGAH